MDKIKTAVILCGGNGTRLGAIGKKIPKTLILVKKKPILWYILSNLILSQNFNHFVLPVGHKGNIVRKYIEKYFIPKFFFLDIKFDIINTGKNTAIAKRIFMINKKILSKNFLLLNGDAIFDFNLGKIFDNHDKKNLDLTLLTCSVMSPFGVVVKKKNKPINFQRDMNYDEIYNLKQNVFGEIFTGMSIIKTNLLKKIDFKNSKNFEINFYPKILKPKNRYNKSCEKINGFWYAMDDLKQVEIANSKENYISKKIQMIKNKFNGK